MNKKKTMTFQSTRNTFIAPRFLLSIVLSLTLCLSLSVLGACTDSGGTASTNTSENQASSETSHSFTDDLGNEVTVNNPKRVVACMGSFASIWELAGGSLIGATDDAFEDYELESKDLSSVGGFESPNLESIISLEPDFVIMTGASTGRGGAASQTDLKQGLEDSGIPVAYFNVTTFEDYLRMLRTCCDITGRDDLYEKNGASVDDEIEVLLSEVDPEKSGARVLLMTTYSGGIRVQNSSTMTGAMLAELGVKNLADENQSLLKDFSLESVIELNPDYILVVPMGNDDEAAMANLKEYTEANPAWASLDAVANGNFITLDKQLFLYKPNQRWAESYQVLFDILYA